jgi:thioesterase domain-containing protein/acyl carrier protein
VAPRIGSPQSSVVVDTPELTGHEVRHHLETLLPPVMIPLRIDVVESLPTSNDWKVDRTPSASAAPVDPLERRLQQIWEDVLEVEGIGPAEAFAGVGGDSLAAAAIVARIETETGRPLALSLLTEATTIETLARQLRERAPSVTVPVQLGTQRAHDSTPLFLAHDLAGDVRLYADLADALPWTTWGLAQTTPLVPGVSFTEHAASLAEQIRAIQPHGPYRVCGHCFGAVLAFELAHQLTARGERVELLALLGVTAWDFPRLAPAPWHLHIERSGLESPQHRIALHLRRARELGFYHGTRHIVGAARAAPAHFRMRSGSHPPRTESTVVQQRNTDAFRAYRPAMFPDTALVLVSASDAHGVDPATAWSRVARQTRVHVVGDANVDMLRTPHAGRTAEILVRSLAEAQTVP